MTGVCSRRMVPDGGAGLAPKMASSSSVRPAPSSPATPRDLAGVHAERDLAQARSSAAGRSRERNVSSSRIARSPIGCLT